HTRLVSDWSSDVCSSDLPARRRIHVHLKKDLEAFLPGQFQNYAQILEVILALFGFAGGPIDPGADGVEAQRLDLPHVLAPDFLLGARIAFQHGGARLAAAIPDRHRE